MGLRTKFLLSLVLASAAITVTSLWMVRGSVGAEFRSRVDKSLQNSAATFRRIHKERESYVARTADMMAADTQLLALMKTDFATAQPEAPSIMRRADADLLVLANPYGRLLAAQTSNSTIPAADVDARFQRAFQARSRQDWWLIDGHLFEVFLQPAYMGSADNRAMAGIFAIGFEIDQSIADEVAQIASGKSVIRYGNDVVVSTLSKPQLDDFVSHAVGEDHRIALGGETFLAHEFTLTGDNSAPVQVVMLQSYDEATRFLSSLNQLVWVVAAVAVILGASFVFVISHTFTRPLAELVSGVRALAKGDYSYPLRTTARDEVAELTFAFDKMRQSLQDSQNRAVNAARMEAIGQLAGGVAHDFNNLVTIIKGYTDLLLLKLPPEDVTCGYAEQIKKAGDRAASVTRQLLAFSRKQVLQPDAIDLNSIAVGMEKMLKVLIGEDIEIKITSEAGLRKVLADPGQMEQILLNLAVNARDAMPKGGKINVITTNVDVDPDHMNPAVGEAHAGRYVRLSFTDTGCGMSPEVAANVFQPFFTTKETGKGTGLGLAIVCGIVKQSKGFVCLTSEPGRGTTFEIFLPEAEKTLAPILPQHAPTKPLMKASETVLLVEDEDALRALAREALRMHGYTVLEAGNGQDALDVFASHAHDVDIVVTDVVMPQLNGVELVEKLRARVPKLKVLFISGYTDRTDEIEQSGFRLLAKPFTPDQLVKAITEAIKSGTGSTDFVSAASN